MTPSVPASARTALDSPPTVCASDAPAAITDAGVVRVMIGAGVVLFLTMLPVAMLVPVLKGLVADRFATTPFWSHSFMSVNMIGALLAAPLAGPWIDRAPRRRPILVLLLIANAATLALMSVADTFWMLLVVRFVEGAFHILAVTTLMAIAADWAPPARRGRFMGMIGAALIFGTASGSPLGGIVGRSNPVLVLWVGAALALAAALLALCVVRDPPERRPAPLRSVRALLRDHPPLWVPLAYAFIDRFCVGVIVSSFVLYLGEVAHLSRPQVGGLLALFLFPFALLCYPAGRLADRIGRVLPMCVGSVLFGVVYALYGVVSPGGLWGLMLASGVLSALMFAPNLAMCADLTPPAQRASAYAGFNFAGSLGFLCGPLAGGAMLAAIGDSLPRVEAYAWTFAAAGSTEVLCALLTLPALLRLRRMGLVR
ncbi:MAG: MFS transporter [Planctomycetia bacterium]|nr:MAG: MFS transporter [Planctomycetia bacterium]